MPHSFGVDYRIVHDDELRTIYHNMGHTCRESAGSGMSSHLCEFLNIDALSVRHSQRLRESYAGMKHQITLYMNDIPPANLDKVLLDIPVEGVQFSIDSQNNGFRQEMVLHLDGDWNTLHFWWWATLLTRIHKGQYKTGIEALNGSIAGHDHHYLMPNDKENAINAWRLLKSGLKLCPYMMSLGGAGPVYATKNTSYHLRPVAVVNTNRTIKEKLVGV